MLFHLIACASLICAQEPQRVRFHAALGDGFITDAELVLPAGTTGRVPAVLLIHGSTPADMDFTVMRGDSGRSQIFRDIADGLASRGIASQIAVHGPAVAGVILQGPVVTSYAATLRGQYRRIGLPYLMRLASADSTVDITAISHAFDGTAGAAGMLARSHAGFLLDREAFAKGERKLNAYFDANKDGRIHLRSEATESYEKILTDGPMMGMYSSARALPGLAVMVDSIAKPLLVLQGAGDGNIDVAAAPIEDAAAWIRQHSKPR